VSDRVCRGFEVPKSWIVVLVVAAGLLLAPFAGWVILAIWLSGFARPIHARLTRWFGGRDHLAAVLPVVGLLLEPVPTAADVTPPVNDSVGFVSKLAENDKVHSMLVSLVGDKNPDPEASVGELVMMQGGKAIGILQIVLSYAAQIVIGLVILFSGMYAMLTEGRRWYTWAEEHFPVGPKAWRRFSEAFVETGRGLMIGIAGSGLLQAIAATIAFFVLDVPQALPLGLLTLVFSIVPLVGTAIVWGPVAVGLAMTGRMYEGIGLAIYGAVVIGSLDNLARPFLTKYGKLQLPGFLVLVSMFGGVEICGGWGILFGPLVVRLAKEALEVRREQVQA